MSSARPRAATIAGIIVLNVPVAFVLTMMLVPLWSAIERRWGIESVGHSGPAPGCYSAVFVCVAALSIGVYLYRLGSPAAPDEGVQP
jgi:hypothetical protein